MEILSSKVEFEEIIKGSRFKSELIPCESQNQAKELIKNKKKEYSDSTHVVHAFIIGSKAEIMGMSDDGEPSGTAGRPALDVLKGRSCTNVLLTITRWFGGTLLGTGGLVKAYSGCAKQVIQKADNLKLFIPLIIKKSFSFTTDYSMHNLIKLSLEKFSIYNLQINFETNILFSGEIAENEYENLKIELKNLSNGQINLS